MVINWLRDEVIPACTAKVRQLIPQNVTYLFLFHFYLHEGKKDSLFQTIAIHLPLKSDKDSGD